MGGSEEGRRVRSWRIEKGGSKEEMTGLREERSGGEEMGGGRIERRGMRSDEKWSEYRAVKGKAKTGSQRTSRREKDTERD